MVSDRDIEFLMDSDQEEEEDEIEIIDTLPDEEKRG